ncbi:MFS transporter [Streptomyces capparidis]
MTTDAGTRAARWDVTLVFFVHGATFANWVPRIPLIKGDLGLSDGALGIALLGAPIGVVAAVRLASWAVGRFGSRAVVRAAALPMCASLVPVALAWNLGSLMAALLLVGLALGMVDVAMNAQGVVVEREYGRPIMSGLHGAYSVGSLTGALTGAAAAHADVRPVVHFSLAAAVLGAAVWLGSRRLLPRDADPVADGDGASAAGGRGFTAAVLVLGVVGLCSFVGEGAVADWSAVYLREDLGASAGVAGLGFAGCAVAMAAGRLAGDRLVARFGPVAVLRTGAVVAAVGLTGGLLAGTQPVAVAGFTLFGLGIAPVAPITFSAAGNLPGVASATAISRVTGIGYLGFLGGPPVLGLIAEVAGLPWALGIPAALAAVMALLGGAVRTGAGPGPGPADAAAAPEPGGAGATGDRRH